ncbi:SufE family protein [Psychrosphaera sp. B3R10]|uniref:SufE family protein n=1 Tax=Psychrosphaera algicola TaxID=3023714 RepID=A0ABT5F9M4_9GAMM|nr:MULTISPECIES: SufE family protein [unclassified Psychrosphaera]MBU2883991.1 SufE family protein [Psychrosphaera sp. I2R16]MBU2988121.1 SufE family protein [Psychrosphaera sp. B3R10]MDC2888226.1 SufE family protein [Psychrosphaera sp. G1-22]MDO6721540.1 SufE family protein [Psychrosphaera sp. 1_MG-2023]
MTFLHLAKQFSISPQKIEQTLNSTTSWETRYRALMLLGKALPAFPEHAKRDENRVLGCESNVWLYAYLEDDKYYFAIGSDAKIVKGLIAILLSKINGQSQKDIIEFDLQQYLTDLKIFGQLSSSRTNGLNAIRNRVVDYLSN